MKEVVRSWFSRDGHITETLHSLADSAEAAAKLICQCELPFMPYLITSFLHISFYFNFFASKNALRNFHCLFFKECSMGVLCRR